LELNLRGKLTKKTLGKQFTSQVAGSVESNREREARRVRKPCWRRGARANEFYGV